MKTPPVEQLKKMSADAVLQPLAALLKANPPPASEAPVLAKLATIGIVPGEKFDPSKLDPAVAKGLEKSLPVALEKLEAASKETRRAGQRLAHAADDRSATSARDYGARAVVALVGLGANLPQDAVYPSAFVDGDGKPLNGANRYVMHFDKGADAAGRRVLVGDDVRRQTRSSSPTRSTATR